MSRPYSSVCRACSVNPTSKHFSPHHTLHHKTDLLCSASPLNGEAAELWDKDMESFKKKVLGRHVDIEDE